MKTIIFLIAVLISFGAKAQLNADSVFTKTYVESNYMLIDTFTNVSSGDVDTVMFSETMDKKNILEVFGSIPTLIVPNNDTVYKIINDYKLDYLRSLKIIRSQKVVKYVYVKEEKPINFQMSDLVRKRYQLDYDIDLFWDHAKVKAIIE